MTRTEAARTGERFYTTKPCKHCSDTQRYVCAGQCVTCSKRRSAEKAQQIAALISAAKA